MAAELIDGTKVGARVREEVRQAVERMPVKPGLATILVGDDPASAIYVGSKRRACVELGIRDLHQHVSADITQESLAELIVGLGADPDVTGILLQLPLPAHLDAQPLIELIPADKDVDGLSILSGGRLARHVPGLYPCTPLGVLELLDSYHVQLVGYRRGRRRPLEPGRLAAGADAFAARRDRHQLPQGHAQPGPRLPPCGRADRRRRCAAAWSTPTTSARARR